MFGRETSLRLRGRGDDNAPKRHLVILTCIMAGILFFLLLQHCSITSPSENKTPMDTQFDWVVSKAVSVTNDPFVEDERGSVKIATKDPDSEVVEITDEGKAKESDEKKEDGNEEFTEDADADEKEVRNEPEEKAGDGIDAIGKEEDGQFEGLRLGSEATSNEDGASGEETEDDGILQVALKSLPVSLYRTSLWKILLPLFRFSLQYEHLQHFFS